MWNLKKKRSNKAKARREREQTGGYQRRRGWGKKGVKGLNCINNDGWQLDLLW